MTKDCIERPCLDTGCEAHILATRMAIVAFDKAWAENSLSDARIACQMLAEIESEWIGTIKDVTGPDSA